MAFLGFDYAKPGPGVQKNEPSYKSILVFFEIYRRKFWDLIKINLLYFASVILLFLPVILLALNHGVGRNLYSLISLLPISLAGPATAGFTYILRNNVWQKHVFLWTDYKDAIRRNWKQSLVAALALIVAVVFTIVCIPFYAQHAQSNPIFVIPLLLCPAAFIWFVFMQYYVFVMIVTFDLKLKQIYKNAFIMAIIGIGRNLLVTILCGAILLLCYISPLADVLIPVIWLSTAGMIVNFAVWPLIQKYMIQNDSEKIVKSDDIRRNVFVDVPTNDVNSKRKRKR
jgi:uncharacterized membrane protein YesL